MDETRMHELEAKRDRIEGWLDDNASEREALLRSRELVRRQLADAEEGSRP